MKPVAIRKKYRLLKWIGLIIFAILLQLVALAWYITQQLKPVLKSELRNWVKTATNGLYHMDYSEVYVNFLTGSVRVENVVIKPDSSVYQQQILAKTAPNNLYRVTLNELLIKRVHLYQLYFNKKVRIKQILFGKPSIVMTNKHFDFNDNKLPSPQTSPYQVLSKIFKSLRVNTVDFKDAKFKYIDNNRAKPTADSVANIFISLKDWLIDEHSATDTTRTYMLKDVSVYLNDYKYATPDSMYYLKLSQLDFSLSKRKLKIKEFEMQPRYPEERFAKVAGYARDRFSIQMNNLEVDSMSLPAYIKKREFLAENLNISNGNISVYADGTMPKQVKNKVGRYPHQLLQQVSELITVKAINLNNVNIKYAAYDTVSHETGNISFESTSGTIKNVTNSPKAKARNGIMHADLQTYLMGQGKMDVAFDFDLNSTKGDFSYKGELILIEGRRFNRIAKPLGHLQIRRGLIRSLAFDIKANDEWADGNVDFQYNDFSVALFRPKKDNDGIKRMGLISMLANALVINSDNPSSNGKHIIAPIHYQRRPTASFFSFIWRTLFEGIKYSVGYSPQKQEEIKDHVEQFRHFRDEFSKH